MSSPLEIPPAPKISIFRPFLAFAAHKTSGGILLLLCTVIALIWANSPWAASYKDLWHTNLTVSLAGRVLSHDLHFWVNDLLMVVFFFVVGLEIKREVLVGELASFRQAALPILAALGGVVVPALLYSALNAGGKGAPGWGIPMATDIAFALGVMALLGERVPLGLKVFLTALAIVDDIAAVLVIAVFYTAELDWGALGLGAVLFAVLLAANRLGVRHPLPYALLGALLWLAVLQSGIHATIAGVALALTIPARTTLRPGEFLRHGRAVLDYFERTAKTEVSAMIDEEQQAAIESLESACERVQPPLHRMENALHNWVTFLVMPVFALANAGVPLTGNFGETLAEPVTLGVILGLLIGKPIGITLASWLAVRSGIASLPAGVSWRQIHGAGWLGGIGFTMSLFVAGLAFADEQLLTMSKLGIFTASFLAGIAGSAILIRKAAAHNSI
jgi:NhaA family Na+:H+ antiporter